jgi:hypothetical protein
MRVFCPTCSEPINIADDLAGKATFCPLCKSPFSAPALFSGGNATPTTITPAAPADPSPPAPTAPAASPSTYSILPPSPAPTPPTSTLPPMSMPKPSPNYAPAPPPAAVPPAPASSAPAPPGTYSGSFGFSFSPEIVQWMAPVFLAIALFLTVFSWNGAYPGGHGVYTQSPWGAMFGVFSTDPVGDDVFKYNPKKPSENQTPLSKQVSMNFLMLLFIPLLFLTTVAAFIFTLLPQLKLKVPPQLEPLVPWRMAIVAGLSALLLGMLCLQSMRGFGLENALIERAEGEIQKERDAAVKPDEQATVEIKQGMLRGGLNLHHTFVMQLAVWCLVLAVFGGVAAFVMMRRVDKPHPRFELMW